MKIPVNLTCSNQDHKNLIAFYWFKRFNPEGIITFKAMQGEYRFTNSYWMKRLVALGWAIPAKNGYRLKSHQYVWRKLGTTPVQRTSAHEGFRYTIKENKEISWKSFSKEALKIIHQHLVDTKVRRIVYRLACRYKSNNRKLNRWSKQFVSEVEKPQFSALSAAKLLGYRSGNTGWKYRFKYFKKAIPDDWEELKGRYSYLHWSGCKIYRNYCDRISLV